MKTFPINLLLDETKHCLVVGGGKVATRKIEKLVQTKVKITVVAPKINSAILELSQDNSIEIIDRAFEENDLDNIFFAFITSNDKSLNLQIIKLCNNHNILCCSVDENWNQGDFITPATFNESGINVAISTNGIACRKTRLIKDGLAKHIKMLENADLFIIGTDHNYLSISERENLHLLNGKLEEVGNMLMHIWGIHEFMLLNTCNRIELIAILCPANGIEKNLEMIMQFNKLNVEGYYTKYGEEAFKHFSYVTAGLLSQTPGEKHIVAQVKSSLAISKINNWSGPMLQQWFDTTLHISKKIRRIADPLLLHVEIENLAVKYLQTRYTTLKNHTLLIIGTGEIGVAIIKQLETFKMHIIWCYHSKKPRHPNNHSSKIKIISMNELRNELGSVDSIITATRSPIPILHKGHSPFFDLSKKITMVDLAIPRNIASDLISVMSNTKILDLDDLKHWHRRENCNMTKIFNLSDNTINENKNMYDKIIYNLQGNNKSQI